MKRGKTLIVLPLFFILSSRRYAGAFEVYLECFAFGICVFADNIFRATNKSVPFNIVSAIVFTIDGFVYFPNQHLTVKVIEYKGSLGIGCTP